MIRTNPATQDFIDQLNMYGASETLENVVPAINSQAWVFYNIKNGSVIPDLTKGTILRIIYDINGGGGEPMNRHRRLPV